MTAPKYRFTYIDVPPEAAAARREADRKRREATPKRKRRVYLDRGDFRYLEKLW